MITKYSKLYNKNIIYNIPYKIRYERLNYIWNISIVGHTVYLNDHDTVNYIKYDLENIQFYLNKWLADYNYTLYYYS